MATHSSLAMMLIVALLICLTSSVVVVAASPSSSSSAACVPESFASTVALSSVQCSMLAPACIALWTPAAAAGFQFNCIQSMLSSQIGAFTASSIAALSNSAVYGISYSNVIGMTSGCAGFSASQMAVLDSGTFYRISIACTSYLAPSALSGWTRVQARAYRRASLYSLTPLQLSGLSPAGASGIDPNDSKAFPPSLCAGWRAPQIAMWQDFYATHVCSAWSAACMANIPAAEYAGFKRECVQYLLPASIAGISAAQMSFIAPTTFFALSAAQVNQFSPASCAGITPAQIAMLSFAYPDDQCTGVTPACLASISQTTMAAMSDTCKSQIFETINDAAAASDSDEIVAQL